MTFPYRKRALQTRRICYHIYMNTQHLHDPNMAYKVGWNDIANGILTWNKHDTWQSALEWAIYCKEIATLSYKNSERCQGVIDCCNQYQKTGRIERKLYTGSIDSMENR